MVDASISATPTSPLVTVAELRRLLAADPSPVVLDVRGRLGLADPRGEYERGHLPGAVYVDLDTELAGPGRPDDGRHPLPDPDVFAASAARWGIGPDTRVAVTDDNAGMSAARAWWLLRWIGHRLVQVLDGGLAAWRAAGGPIVAGIEEPLPGRGPAVVPGSMPVVTAGAVPALAVRGVLLDARAAARYRGEVEPVDPVAGHVPGAVSSPTAELVDDTGRFRPVEELRARFAGLGIDGGDAVPVGAYCGSGVTAAHTILALELVGVHAALYPGSWSGWVSDPGRPVAIGADPGRPSG